MSEVKTMTASERARQKKARRAAFGAAIMRAEGQRRDNAMARAAALAALRALWMGGPR